MSDLLYNLDAEKSVLGAMMISQDATISAIGRINPDDFYLEAHKIIFETYKELDRNDISIDFVTTTDALDKSGLMKKAGGYEYINEISTFVPSAANVENYIDIVIWKSMSRKLLKVAGDSVKAIQSDNASPDDVASEIIKRVEDIANRQSGQTTEFTAKQFAHGLMDDIEYAMEHPDTKDLERVKTGMREHDDHCIMYKSNVVIIAGRPGMGKSAYTQKILNSFAEQGNKVAMFSLEMSKSELRQRFASQITGVPLECIRSASLDPNQLKQMWSAFGTIDKYDMLFVDDPGITLQGIWNRCKRQKAKHGLDVVAIDYLQLINPGPEYRYTSNRNIEVGNMTRALKLMARKLDIAVLLVCQLSREVEKRKEKKPILADLRESGAIEQDADIVLFPYREAYALEGLEAAKKADPSLAEIGIRKNRNGATWTIPMTWIPETVTFRERIPGVRPSTYRKD